MAVGLPVGAASNLERRGRRRRSRCGAAASKLYTDAETNGDLARANPIIDTIIQTYEQHPTLPSPEMLNAVFSNTQPDAPLRRLIIDIWTDHPLKYNPMECGMSDLPGMSGEVRVVALNAMRRRLRVHFGGEGQVAEGEGGRCGYHRHDERVPRCG
ncbi:hypothetical protein LTR85_001121 [Meristemomyces frigidus]|nr:hypothetical protein LTR85_001121 [Meristemomyces frigidus]